MAFVVEDGTGLATATSLVSEAFADTYHTAHLNSTWVGQVSATKQYQLNSATEYLHYEYGQRLFGSRVNEVQALDYPRKEITTIDGFTIDNDIVPPGIGNVVCEVAELIRLGELFFVAQAASDKNIKKTRDKVGPIETETEYNGSKSLTKSYPKIDAMMADWSNPPGMIMRA